MGWAGMGVWYHQIVRMNESVQEISDNNIGFISPDYGGWYRLNRLKSKTKEAVGKREKNSTKHMYIVFACIPVFLAKLGALGRWGIYSL